MLTLLFGKQLFQLPYLFFALGKSALFILNGFFVLTDDLGGALHHIGGVRHVGLGHLILAVKLVVDLGLLANAGKQLLGRIFIVL